MIKNPEIRAYNIMLRSYSGLKDDKGKDSQICRALLLYREMLRNGILPNNLTFPFLLKDCTRRLDESTGLGIHAQVVKFGFSDDIFVGNSLINLYMAFRLLNNARKLFDEMPVRDVVTWNSMIIGFLRNGELDNAMELFNRMGEKNIITWNSIITGLVQGGQPKESLQLFHQMQVSGEDNNTVEPDKFTIATVLLACAQLGSIDHGKWVHSYLRRSGLECDVVIGTALVNMYGKCGHADQAIKIFKEMPEKDASAWTAMISVLALHGLGEKAFDCFRDMEKAGVKPNHVTFVGLLSASAHSGLVEKVRWCFEMMTTVYSIEPQVYHYACMVDILSRAKLFEEAERVIREMPMKPDVYVWGSLLGGCQMHRNFELGEKVAIHLIQLEPNNHAFYMNLCDIYGKAGQFDAAKRVRNVMKERGIQKEIPGCSMTEICGVVHEFSAGVSLNLPVEILLVLNELNNQMKLLPGW
ncbi:hypothetical protein K1719_016982 [Acacia pycnantha]|nr:hypothetical protein K1719_016982 [Acacia pycnantha]